MRFAVRFDTYASTLKNEKLLALLGKLKRCEDRIQYRFLGCLSEINRRKLYAVEGYPSLFSFLVGRFGYSESCAWKRCQVMKKASQVPLLYYAIQQGKLSLSSAERLCPYLTDENCEALFEECSGKSVREVEKIVVRHFPKAKIDDSMKQKITPLSIDEVSIHFTATTRFAEKLERAKAILSHKHPEGKIAETLEDALDVLLQKIDPTQAATPAESDQIDEKAIDLPRGRKSMDTRHIPKIIRFRVWKRDGGRCAFVSTSGHRCEAVRFLEVDHIEPWALGGSSHDIDNLQLLCSAHNKLRASQTFTEFWRDVSHQQQGIAQN